MKRSFLNRAISFALACTYLMSAGWISFYLFFGGVGVYADSNDEFSIVLSKITQGERDVSRLSGSMKNLTLVFSIRNAHTDTGWKLAFLHNGGFTSTDPGTISKKSTINGKFQFTLTVTGCTYNGSADVASFTLRSGGETYSTSLSPWRSIGGADYSLQSYVFYDAGDRQLQRLKKNTHIGRLIFTIKDNGLTKGEYDNANKADFSATINYATFTKTNKEQPSFSPTATLLNDGSISYTITFYDLRYTGKTDQLELKIGYPSIFGLTRRQFSEPLIEGEIYVPPASSEASSSSSAVEIAPPTPNLIITAYNYGGGSPTAASTVMLDISFTNTSHQLPVENIVLKVTMPEAFTLTNSSNTFYIERMDPGAVEQRTIGFTVKPNAEAISHPIKLSFAFETIIKDERKPLTSEQEISIPVSQLNRMSLNPVEVPLEIHMDPNGGGYNLEASFVNKGKATVYNVSLSIASDNLLQPLQLQYIGNLESGKQGTADFSLMPAMPGPLTGEIVLSYEDSNMNVSELRTPFQSQAIQASLPMPEPDPGATDIEAASTAWYQGVPLWQWAIAGIVLIIVLAFATKTVRALKEKKLEAEDEDF